MDKFLHRGVLLLLLTCHGYPSSQADLRAQEAISGQTQSLGQKESDLLKRAQESLAEGRLDEGISRLRSLIERDPDQLEARLLLGSTLALLARRSEAIGELEEVIRRHPDYAPAYETLGQILVRFGDLELARQAFERVVKLSPTSTPARLNLALVLAQLREFEGAGEQLDQVIARLGNSETSAYPHYLRGKIYNELNQSEQALEHFETAVALRPAYTEAYLDCGLTLRRLGRSEAALKAFQKAVALDPERPEANHYLGREYLALDQADLAVGHLEKALSAHPGDTSILFSLARAYQLLGLKEEALEAGEQLRASQKELQELKSNSLKLTELNHEAIELEKQGEFEKAEGIFREALRIDPSNGNIRSNLGLLMCRTGRWKEGIGELRRAQDTNPEDPKIRKALAVALDRAKEAGINVAEMEPTDLNQDTPR